MTVAEMERAAAPAREQAALGTATDNSKNTTSSTTAQASPGPRAINECPRYLSCSAPFCVLDPQLRQRVHRKGDRVCFYLTEAVKDGAAARFETRADGDIYLAAVEVLSGEEPLDSGLEKRLRAAMQSGSQIERGRQLADVEVA